jgi:hypothetical protein
MILLLTMLFACGEKETTTEVATPTVTNIIVETKTLETTDETTTDNTVEVSKDANDSTSGESKTEVTPTSTEITNTNEGVNND